MKHFSLWVALILVAIPGFSKKPTANEVIQLIKDHINCAWSDETVDTFKSGNPDDEVTGIVSCMFADMNVLKEAVAKNCNLIITHEPVYFNHQDEKAGMENDPVLQTKLAYIKKHGLIIWRFHDHWHRHKPDGIYHGFIKELGWNNHRVDDRWDFVKVKKQSLADFASSLKEKLNIDGVRVIGNPEQQIENVSLCLGAPGWGRHLSKFTNENMDVMIAGEAHEWETYQYVNDAVNEGRNLSIIFLGHIPTEEPGMRYFAEWLEELDPGVPVFFVKDKLPYWSVK